MTCRKVYDGDCPTCPDLGDGKGVTVGNILDAIRACPTVADVNSVAVHYGSHVAIMMRSGGYVRAIGLNIKNLAAYKRQEIGEPWRDVRP